MKSRPSHCGFSDEDLCCLGCGQKLGCIQPGHCYAVEGQAALHPKTRITPEVEEPRDETER